MKRPYITVFVAAIFLVSMICTVTAGSVAIETSIQKLAENPKAFDGRQVTLQGFLTSEQLFAEPTRHYLRDEMGSLVQLKLPENDAVSSYAGKRVEVTGVCGLAGSEAQLTVKQFTPLEEANPESSLVTGPQNTIVIMAYFSDRLNTKSQGDVYRQVFNDMNGYYVEASYELLYVTGSWNAWVQLSQTVAYYGNLNPSWYFIRDAVAAVDSSVNFAGYTRLLFVCAGPNEESSGNANDIWSARWSGLNIATNDGITITHAAIVPDKEAGTAGVIGVTAHEYGHELGLPDLYGYVGGVGQWDGMAEGTWNNNGNTPASFTSYIRNLQGWIASSKIRTISAGTAELLMLDPLEDPTGTIQVIRLYDGANYYLIEARRKIGYDAYLPSESVLVLYYEAATQKLFLRATKSSGGTYRVGNVEIYVVKQDIENWAFQVYVSYKSWSTDRRLTSNAAASNTNWRGGAVASAGRYVYVVWDETRDGNWEIYFKRSADYGNTWSADLRLTNNAASSWYPTVAAYGSYVYVTWQDFRDGNWEIYAKRSENYGGSWYAEERLTIQSASSNYPSVAAFHRYVHVVWHDFRDNQWEVYYRRSADNGLTWGSTTRLSKLGNASDQAKVATYASNVYVVWEDWRNGNWDIYTRKSTNNGTSWGSEIRLTTNTLNQMFPSVAAYGYDVHVAWTDFRNAGNMEIYYRRSTDKGVTYKTEVRLTNAAGISEQPSLAVAGRTVYLVWTDNRTGTYEVWFKDSPDRGVHWTADRILSAQPNKSYWPSVSVAGDNVYVAWTDERNGNQEIYFKYRW
jgi:M6 family metalloprotease-like protein